MILTAATGQSTRCLSLIPEVTHIFLILYSMFMVWVLSNVGGLIDPPLQLGWLIMCNPHFRRCWLPSFCKLLLSHLAHPHALTRNAALSTGMPRQGVRTTPSMDFSSLSSTPSPSEPVRDFPS